MSRVKGGPRGHRKHVKILNAAKGFRGTRNRLFKKANESVLKAGAYAYVGRRNRRRDMRTLWISRINGALSEYNLKYSRFVHALKKNNIELDRKVLSDMAINNKSGFAELVSKVTTK